MANVIQIALGWLARTCLAKTSGNLRLSGLHAPVEVIRDRWGVPHIYGQSVQDLLFAQGFVHAQDRLWQMEFQRRLVAGRLAEVLGAVALPVDRWMRILTMRRVAEREVALLRPDVRSEIDAYVAGVNALLSLGKLPVEFTLLRYRPEPWTAADTLSWAKMMAWTLSVNWETELLRGRLIALLGPERIAELEPGYFARYPTIAQTSDLTGFRNLSGLALERAAAARTFAGPAAQEGLGSNSWVIAGSRTATGRPLLANDMHLLMGIPPVWYENHLVSRPAGDDIEVSGVTFPGIPYVVAGHNAHVSWGFTNGFADVQDLYMEHLRRTAGGRVQYEYRGEWLDAEMLQEEIRIKGGQPAVQEVVITRHGPVINALAPDLAGDGSAGLTEGQPLALQWTSLQPATAVHALYAMSRARTCLEFREALREWAGPVQNTVYADVDGNIGYSLPGNIPIRARGDGRVPAPGWKGEYEWTGYIPFDELPHLYNPPQGYIVTANNKVVGDDYPYFLSAEYCMADRAQRITELIESCRDVDVAFVRRMHFDQVSPTAQVIAGHLGQLTVKDRELVRIVAMMRDWDGTLAADSAPAAVYEVFMRQMLELILTNKLLDLTPRYMGRGPTPALTEHSLFGHRSWEWLQTLLVQEESHWYDLAPHEMLRSGESWFTTRDDAMISALRLTADFLKKRLGPEPGAWAWGKLHKLRYVHVVGQIPALAPIFNRGPYPAGGDANTVWAASSSLHTVDSDQIVGPPFRYISDVGDWRNSVGLLAPGNSGQPGSRHYDDQIGAWFEGGYHPLLFTREDVEREAEARLTLSP